MSVINKASSLNEPHQKEVYKETEAGPEARVWEARRTWASKEMSDEEIEVGGRKEGGERKEVSCGTKKRRGWGYGA